MPYKPTIIMTEEEENELNAELVAEVNSYLNSPKRLYDLFCLDVSNQSPEEQLNHYKLIHLLAKLKIFGEF